MKKLACFLLTLLIVGCAQRIDDGNIVPADDDSDPVPDAGSGSNPDTDSEPDPNPACTEDIWTCSEWGTCSTSGSQTRSCSVTTDCATATTPSPATTQTCTPPSTCTADIWTCSEWGTCSTSGSQTRSCSVTTDCATATTPSPATTQSCTTTVPNGTISCTDVLNGQYVDVTISSVAAHLKKSDGSGEDADGTVTPNASFLLRWGSDQAGWGIVNPYDPNKDQEGWFDGSIVLRLPGNTATFNPALYNPNTNAVYWLDDDEFTVSGTCSHVTGATAITHTPPPQPIVGTIQCRLWDNGAGVKREIMITPNSNGIIAGTETEGSPVPSPESIELDVTAARQLWNGTTSNGNISTYFFYADLSVTGFNFIVRDNNDGNDSIPGGDYFQLNAWNVTNVTTSYGSSNCHRVGGGIYVN